MTRNEVVFVAVVAGAAFVWGMAVGEEDAAVKLQPCPLADRKLLYRETADACEYIRKPYGAGVWQYMKREGLAK